MKVLSKQTICEWKNVLPERPEPNSKLGIALGTIGRQPINGLRHKPECDTNGWYIWCGTEFSQSPNFFSPLHVKHLNKYLPEIAEYLNLPPGHRFLIDGSNFEDVWFDSELLTCR